jgi:hypothetical protein
MTPLPVPIIALGLPPPRKRSIMLVGWREIVVFLTWTTAWMDFSAASVKSRLGDSPTLEEKLVFTIGFAVKWSSDADRGGWFCKYLKIKRQDSVVRALMSIGTIKRFIGGVVY